MKTSQILFNNISFNTSLQGHLCGFQGETKGLDEIPAKSIPPGSAPGLSTPFDRSVRAPSKTMTR